jgi:hypothetical protein
LFEKINLGEKGLLPDQDERKKLSSSLSITFPICTSILFFFLSPDMCMTHEILFEILPQLISFQKGDFCQNP